jgi:RNA polymerase sigma factor (sigma-70 family)
MINKYLQDHYQEILNKVKGVTKNHHLTEDLLQDCILAFLEKGNDYIHQVLLDGKVQHYLVRMCHIQFNSSTSPFYTQYKKSSLRTNDIEDYEVEDKPQEKEVDKKELVKDIRIYIGKLPLYERTITERHMIDGVSQREMSRYYNINRLHIGKTINTVQKNIRINFNKDDYKTE